MINRRAILLAAAICGLGLPAQATEWLSCFDDTGTYGVNLLLGSTEKLSIAGIIVSTDKKTWASSPEYAPGEGVQVAQAFEDAETLRVDLTDDNFMLNIAHLRVFKAQLNGGETIQSGTLVITDSGVWPVVCKGE